MLMALLCSGIGVRPALAMPVVTGAMFAWNFMVARWAMRRRTCLG